MCWRARTGPKLLIATGSEVNLAVAAYEQLETEGIAAQVVSMPSWELFEEQDQAYRDSVLPPTVKARVVVEQAGPLGWDRYVGQTGAKVVMNSFGASGAWPSCRKSSALPWRI
jgi:transketolase